MDADTHSQILAEGIIPHLHMPKGQPAGESRASRSADIASPSRKRRVELPELTA
ncbi:MAG TPA: hypothetical protein VI365_35295 [Trebonia sp.]